MGMLAKLFDFRTPPPTVEPRARYSANVGNLTEVEWSKKWMNGTLETTGGEAVTEDTACSVTAVYQAVRVRALAKAMVPLKLYRKLPGGGSEVASDDRRNTIISRRWNDSMPSQLARRVMSWNEDFYGNSFAFLDWSRSGLKQIIPICSKRVQIQFDAAGKMYYFILTRKGEPKAIPRDFIMHNVSGLSTDGVVGTSPLFYGANAISTALAADKQAGSYFRNNAKLGGVLVHPKTLSQDAVNRLEADFEKKRQGAGNAYKTLILEEGMQFQKMTMDASEIELMASRQWTVSEVARIFNTSPTLLFDYGRATWGNAEDMRLQFTVLGLQPELSLTEQVYDQSLLTEKEQETMYFKHDFKGLLRGDNKTRWETYKTARDIGVMSPDEVRELEEMNPLPDGQGKVWAAPLNMGNLKDASLTAEDKAKLAQQPKTEDPPKDEENVDDKKAAKKKKKNALRNAFAEIIADKMSAIVRKESAFISKQIKRKDEDRAKSASEFFATHSDYVEDVLQPALRAWCIANEIDPIQERQLSNKLGDWSDDFVGRSETVMSEIDSDEKAQSIIAEWRQAKATDETTILLAEIERLTGDDE